MDEKKLILVVDDEAAILEVMEPTLLGLGYEVHCTTDSTDALRFAEANNVALLLTDIMMPHMTGIELAKLVLATKPQIKVLVMTGYSPQGCSDYPVLYKPFRMADLLTRIRIALG